MKIQAKDCANGGMFQMEPERGDGTATRITHTLGAGRLLLRQPELPRPRGRRVPYKDTTATVTARDQHRLRPRAQVRRPRQPAGRDARAAGLREQIPAPRRPGGVQNVDHCGGVSVWDVASGGRMGGVIGEDAIEVAPPATTCTQECQAQNQVAGRRSCSASRSRCRRRTG